MIDHDEASLFRLAYTKPHQPQPVWGIWVGNDSKLSLISAFLADLKRIQIPLNSFRDFRADKLFQLLSQAVGFKFESKFKPPAGHLAITPAGYSRRQSKVLTAKSIAELSGQSSGTTWVLTMGKHKYRVFLIWLKSLLATSCSL